MRRLLILSICIGAVLGALQALTYGRVLSDGLRDPLRISSDGLWILILSSILWSVLLATVVVVKLRASSVMFDEEDSPIHNRITVLVLSIIAVAAGFFAGPFFGLFTKLLPLIDSITSHEAVERILAYLRIDPDHLLNLLWSSILAVLGFRLARRPPLAAAYAGFCFSPYTAILALIAIDDIWLSEKDPHSSHLPIVFIGLLGLFGISMTVGGYRLGRWLLRPLGASWRRR